MQAFIKDNKMIVNTMIQKDELDELLEFIAKTDTHNIKPVKLYNIEGDISGIAFELEEKGDQA